MRSLVVLLVLLTSVPAPAQDDDAGRELTVVPFPFLFYQDETELGGGVSLSLITRRKADDARSENSGVVFMYTARNQYSVAGAFERYLDRERWHVFANLGFEEFPSDFFGYGNDTPADADEVFTPRGVFGLVAVEREFSGRWRTGPRLQVRTREIIETEEDGLIETLRPNGSDGADVVALGWSVVFDGRDHVFYPTRGWWLRVGTDVATTALGSDDAFASYELDARSFREISDGGPVLAGRVVVRHTSGAAPFDMLPQLGGAQLLRGFFGGRFRDRTLYAVQAEARFGHWKRLGAVVFTEVGRVASGLEALSTADLHLSYGIGLRVQLSTAEKLHVRADLGRTDEGDGGFYLAFQEAF